MNNNPLKAAILIISDTAYADPSTDKTLPVLSSVFEEGDGNWVVSQRCIVPDNAAVIRTEVVDWCEKVGDDTVNLIVTSGGTGFAVRDQTPEAISPLIQKHAPGLIHAMLNASFQITPFAMMSRPVAGVRNHTLIITLPGSPKGAKENLEAILKLLPHACLQAAGADSRLLHAGGVKRLEQDSGVGRGSFIDLRHHHSHDHSHSHSHGTGHRHPTPRAHTSGGGGAISNDPKAGPTRRHRESPYPMLSVDEATELIFQHTQRPKAMTRLVGPSLVGSVLAHDVKAAENVPAFRASTVDGYAIVINQATGGSKGYFPVVSVSHASPVRLEPLAHGQLARITTGACLPPGATSVVMVEDTVLHGMTDDGQEEEEVEILTDEIEPGENVREVGSDIRAGEIILNEGTEITAVGGELGLLASVGQATVLVYRKPIVGVLSTGDEIVQHDRAEALRLGEVRDCNRPTIIAAVRSWGFEVVDLGIAKDTTGALETALRNALRTVDVIITTGGVSMGELDLLKPTIERSLGGTIHFGRVAMKPGKPTTFATIPFKDNNGDRLTRLIFSLPGNPASAVVTLHLFVLPSLNWASGKTTNGLPMIRATVQEDINRDRTRMEYHRAIVKAGAEGALLASSTGGQRSSRIGSLKSANALLVVPPGSSKVKTGTQVRALLIGQIEGIGT